ncbi:MAG: NAD(+) diphosphatase [Alphaproteobacteria bacterium]|nr:NAD(+) diphosphatase [Alphaproteobacteria bacterium]
MQQPNFYASARLDRAAHRRGDPDWLERLRRDPTTRIIPIWRSRSLVVTGEQPQAVMPAVATAAALLEHAGEAIFMGLIDEIAHVAIDLSHHDDPLALAPIARSGEFVDLRAVGALLSRDEGSMLAYARGILHWHRQTRFCGVCGSPTELREAGHLRVCTNPACAAHHFPRTDPAVIMLVSRGDRCLLGRKSEWPDGMYSTLAGFVEPGESLENAVAREVMEETGVAISNIRYHSSQPWPFPASLMLGFYATAETEEINYDPAELEHARWFTRAELADGGAGIRHRPRSDSIARRLIETWVAGG